MVIPPFWGPPGHGATAPDPIIWWIVVPIFAYLLAIWIASQFAAVFALHNQWRARVAETLEYPHDEKEN